ncbi:MAG: hypothetical protein JW807_17945 [Spirochaetes bacterium]|nr:hypothetical protein [Spirochaetota bacterium]
MRSKTTNVLQGVVLLTGIVYILIGLAFYISPYGVLKAFSPSVESRAVGYHGDAESRGGAVASYEGEGLAEEDWLKQIVNDEIISPLYYILRVFAALLLVSGIAMIMPLFDPLRYRGLIYYNGMIFPFVAALSMIVFINSQKSINIKIAAEAGKETVTWQVGHMVITVLAIVFTVIFLLTVITLLMTRKQAKEGKE